jgi:hypothetical protein
MPARNLGGGIGFNGPGLPPRADGAHITAKTIAGLRFFFGEINRIGRISGENPHVR